MERRWLTSELNGGRFCEIVYSIIDGMVSGEFAVSKPKSMVESCRKLENQSSLPRGLRLLVLKLLPALYEIRNNRGVGHVGGEVNSNYMDCAVVVSMCSWIMAELVRTQSDITADEAQSIVDSLSERKIPLVWEDEGLKRVLVPSMSMMDKILVLLHSCASGSNFSQLSEWVESTNSTYFKKMLKKLHAQKFVEFNQTTSTVKILPPGSHAASQILHQHFKKHDPLI